MLKFLRTIIKALSPARSVPPKSYVEPEPLIPTRFAELFAKEDVWLVAFEPDKAKIPDGCNFILWFESDHSQEELLKAFEFKGWQARVGYSGFTLTQITHTYTRSGRNEYDEIKMAAMVTAKPSDLIVLAGNCTYPESIGAEFRKLILRLEGQSNNSFCLYIEGGELWREIPASTELLGMDANSLSDSDIAFLNTGYIIQVDDSPASCSSVQQLQSKVELISPSVVADEEGYNHITCWPYPGRRLWNQVHEVGLYPSWGPNFMCVQNYVEIKGDSFDDFIHMESQGLSKFITRLGVLPGFSLEKFEEALKILYNEEELVWKKSDDEVNETLQV